ncbi:MULTISPECIES: transcriptional repressor MprA [Gulbenkiania]|uniref:DNA-binding transcriptional regulator, MarR family n=2 Tax=Gulbenkiania TaxID=397456 RepID=A0A0K6GTI7_9NEIS|nr:MULTISPECIES: transcriptional repressor MprA [Gulbenkiania]TCW31738.1 MarR family transcriptional repressor of emrRAB [Gulbenkiania mobilis]CUA81863.1 DNA-binding transcriptional regulator, MarR family [Gulbenkiania indica]
MTRSFTQLEQAMERVETLAPGVPRQEVILTRLYYHIMPRLSGYLNDILKEHGVNETVWMALLTLYACPNQTLNPSDISDTLDSSRTNATRISDELVRHGWAARVPCCDDRRKIRLDLTEEGVRFIESVLPVSRAAHRDLWSAFSTEEKTQLETLLRKLLTRLGG